MKKDPNRRPEHKYNEGQAKEPRMQNVASVVIGVAIGEQHSEVSQTQLENR